MADTQQLSETFHAAIGKAVARASDAMDAHNVTATAEATAFANVAKTLSEAFKIAREAQP